MVNGEVPGNLAPDPPPDPSSSTEFGSLADFLNDKKNAEIINLISKSKFATYTKPGKSCYYMIINILNVSRCQKLRDMQFGDKCPILDLYKRLALKEKEDVREAILFLQKEVTAALENVRAEKSKHQSSMKDFFKPVNHSQDGMNDTNQNPEVASTSVSDSTPKPSTSKQNFLTDLFDVLKINENPENIERELHIDPHLFKATDMILLIQSFNSNKQEFDKKSLFQHRSSQFLKDINTILRKIMELRESFIQLNILCDKEKNMEQAKELTFAEMGPFLSGKIQQANALARKLSIDLNSESLKTIFRQTIHTFRKRLSYMRKEVDLALHIICYKADSSWEDSLQNIHDINWTSSSSNGNLNIDHFERCYSYFKAMEFRGDEFVQAWILLDWLGIKSSHVLALKTLLENLPIIQIKKAETSVLMNVTSFLSSQTMLEEMLNVVQKDTEKTLNKDGVILKQPGEVPVAERKEGSGRPRIVDKNPEILDVVRNFAENSGVAAHGRRREDVGHFGFSMSDLQNLVTGMVFNGNKEKAPSVCTLRRLFEPPAKNTKTSRYYKSYINARPGTKSNNAPAGGQRHIHQHECFTTVKHIRELFSLHMKECVTMSCDNKCKIPVGTSAVNRLTSLKKKFFLTGEAPDHADHDIRSGRLIVPEGYQILMGENNFEDTDSEDEGIGENSFDDTDTEDEGEQDPDETVVSIRSEDEGEEEIGNRSETIDDQPDPYLEYFDNTVHEMLLPVSRGEVGNSSEKSGDSDTEFEVVEEVEPLLDATGPHHPVADIMYSPLKEDQGDKEELEQGSITTSHDQPHPMLESIDDTVHEGWSSLSKEIDPNNNSKDNSTDEEEKMLGFASKEKGDLDINNNSTDTSIDQMLGSDDPNKDTMDTFVVFSSSPRENKTFQGADHLDVSSEKESRPEEVQSFLLEEQLEPVVGHLELSIEDAICQLDGNDSDSDDFGEEDFIGILRRTSQRNNQVISSSEEDTGGSDDETSNPDDVIPTHEDELNEEIETEAVFNTKGILTKDKYGRDHVSYPSTGPSYVFLKSNRAKPSNIWSHVNDIMTIYEAHDGLKPKPNLALLLDDGIDWGMRGLQTFYFLGYLWKALDLDLLVIGRNAPGDSKWNPIERLWSYITTKLAGLVIPDFGTELEDDEADEAGIKFLIDSALTDLRYDEHAVVPVPVPCRDDYVTINGAVFDNGQIKQEDADVIQNIMTDKKMNKRMLKEKHPEIADNITTFYKHSDVRAHNIIFRKCDPKSRPCKYCKVNPIRSSDEFWSCLPKKQQGGLFFDCEEDSLQPGHYRTLLDLLGDISELSIKPDGQFSEIKRCQEKDCLYSFKSLQDSQRHHRIAHGTTGPKVNEHVCKFKIDGSVCGQVFTTKWNLTKHKNTSGHKMSRKNKNV